MGPGAAKESLGKPRVGAGTGSELGFPAEVPASARPRTPDMGGLAFGAGGMGMGCFSL